MMNQVFLVALGGALGSVLRYGAGMLIKADAAGSFPLSTLLINVIGSFFIGLLYAGWQQSPSFASLKPFFIVGVLGGFTTFSAFSFEVVALVQTAKTATAALYILSSNVLGIGAALLGFKLLS